MPVLKRADAEIYFEEFGAGYPVLLFAPGGLRSRIEMWRAPPQGPARAWNDWTDTLAAAFASSPWTSAMPHVRGPPLPPIMVGTPTPPTTWR